MSYIYLITNTINDRVYVGKTSRTIKQRWLEHVGDVNKYLDRPLYRAMKKYGVENFSIHLIEEVSDDKADEREQYWIQMYRSYKFGYNATMGGDGTKYIDYDVVVETYNNTGNQQETADLLGIHRETVRYILKINDVEILPISVVNKKKFGKVVNMFDLQGQYLRTFASLKEAANYMVENNLTGCNQSTMRTHISEVCRGKRKTAAKHIWKFKGEYL